MTSLNIHITTFNCGRALVNHEAFCSALAQSFRSGSLPPDLIVLALQEIAPIGPSFLGGSLLTPYFTRFTDVVRDATQSRFGDGADLQTVIVRNVGMTGIMIFARKEIKANIKWLESAGVGCGVREMGNKGAVGVRLALETRADGDDEVLTFVAAHLAPMEGEWERRNNDWRSICQGLVFEPVNGSGLPKTIEDDAGEETEPLLNSTNDTGKHPSKLHGLFDPPSVVFFAGDLNYRTSDTSPNPEDYKNWPRPPIASANGKDFSSMLVRDQLARERTAKSTLHSLSEAPISFPPTYKYSTAAQNFAAEQVSPGSTTASKSRPPQPTSQESLWSTHRVPSWCDRILYRTLSPASTSTSTSSAPQVHSYTALPVQPTSDHRPVVLSCTLRKEDFAQSSGLPEVPFSISPDWRSRRAAARRLEVAVGLGAWLGFTGQGRVVLVGVPIGLVVGWWVMWSLLAS